MTKWSYKQGRKRKIDNLEEFEKNIEGYFNQVYTDVTYKQDFIKGGERAGELVKIPVVRMPTKESLANWLGISVATWYSMRKDAKEGRMGNRSDEFHDLFIYADQKMYAIKAELAAIGEYSPAFTAVELGLKNKTEIDASDGLKEVIYKIHGFGEPQDRPDLKE